MTSTSAACQRMSTFLFLRAWTFCPRNRSSSGRQVWLRDRGRPGREEESMAEGIHSKILLLRKYFPASQQVWEEGDCRFEMATRMLILEFPPRLLWPPSKGSDFYLLLVFSRGRRRGCQRNYNHPSLFPSKGQSEQK